MKRPRRDDASTNHAVCNGTLRVYCSAGDFVVRQVGNEADFEDAMTTDSVDLVIHFRPPLDAARVPSTVVALRYEGARHVDTPVLFAQTLKPLEEGVPLVLRPDELEYRCFDTYVAHVKQGRLYALHLSVDNVMTGAPSNGSADLALAVHVNTKLHFLAERLGPQRCVTLPWFPPDVDPAQWGLRVDPRRIPQRTPLWFKLRGEVSGSRAYALLGWYADEKGRAMNAFSKSAMRLGTLSEDLILLCYCHRYPDRTFHEVGWCPAPATPPGRYPLGWGASPDGMVVDPTMTWERLPPDIAVQYEDPASRQGIDITRGGCEFKTSRTKLCVEPYFMAQVYMEMIALQVVWCDLVRYRPSRVWDAEMDEWRYDDTAHVYRIYRDKDIENRLLPLWKHAHTNQHVLTDVIKEERYVTIRAELTRRARDEQPVDVISVAHHPDLAATLKQYADYKWEATLPNAPVPAESTPGADWDAMAQRLQELRSLPRDSPRFVQLVGAQIQEYASLLF